MSGYQASEQEIAEYNEQNGGGYEEDNNDGYYEEDGLYAYEDNQEASYIGPEDGELESYIGEDDGEGYEDTPRGEEEDEEEQLPGDPTKLASSITRCMAGLPQTRELIGLKIPYGAWEPDTLITDTFGNPMFSVLDVQHHAMGAYEAIFGDENGHKLCYVKRRLITNYYNDGWDFCTYKPNFPGQPRYKERDMYGKSVFPFSFLHIRPMKCRYEYSVHRDDMEGMDTLLHAMHGWLGSMTVCCTPMVRFGKWQVEFHRPEAGDPELNIDQSKNLLEVERGNDLLAALCISYAFDKALCQPLVTIIGYEEKEHLDDDDDSLDSFDADGLGAAAAPRGMPPKSNESMLDDDAYADRDFYPEEEELPEVDGYLEAAPYEEDEDQPPVSGYLEDVAYDDPYEPEEAPISGYLESGGGGDYDDGYGGQNNDLLDDGGYDGGYGGGQNNDLLDDGTGTYDESMDSGGYYLNDGSQQEEDFHGLD